MRLTDFPSNRVVYTTKFVALKQEEITYVSLDEEGDLQVLGRNGPDIKNAMLVSLKQIITIDETILKIANIEIGQAYERDNTGSSWKLLHPTSKSG